VSHILSNIEIIYNRILYTIIILTYIPPANKALTSGWDSKMSRSILQKGSFKNVEMISPIFTELWGPRLIFNQPEVQKPS